MIEARGLSKRFGAVSALKGVDLRIRRGEVFGLLGPNGAGKSTVMKILCGLVRPSAGWAEVGGFDVVAHAAQAQRLVGYLPERVPIYKGLTARENLRLFARLRGIWRSELERTIEARLAEVRLGDVIGRPVEQFSKGMTQRLGIARALLSDPSVLFLDEPFNGLDPRGRREVRALIQSLGRHGRTVFLCSHDLPEVQAVCSRLGLLRRGELVRLQGAGKSRGDVRRFRVEVAGPSRRARAAVAKASGVRRLDGDAAVLRVDADPGVTRVQLALALRKAGVLYLSVDEVRPGLEALYDEYIGTEGTGVS